MVLGHGHRRHSAASSRSSVDDTKDASFSTTADDETVVDGEQGNVLMHIIAQLRPGADLSRVTLPTFILEPRSMLERITNFMAHPETLVPMNKIDDPVERFISVVKFYLSGWHIKPPGVKKPLNPILGETYTCYWDYSDKTRGYYIAEQTSHHPPKSSYFFMIPEHHIRIDGTLKPRSKFLGNSAASMMEGIAVMRFLNRGERFFVTQPNMYARGILFGKMKYELGDHSFVRCPESGLMADLEFKTKGYFGGTYNAIGGYIKDTNIDKNLFELSGLWTGEMFIKDLATGKKTLLFDASKSTPTFPKVRPLNEQDERESQRLWEKVTTALKDKNQDVATEEKTRIEDVQRDEARRREDDGLDWHPRLFRRVQGGRGGSEEGEEDLDWIINAKIDAKTPAEQTRQILNIAAIIPGQDPHRRFSIPSRKDSLERVPTHKSHSSSQNHETPGPGPTSHLKEASSHPQPSPNLNQNQNPTTNAPPPPEHPEKQSAPSLPAPPREGEEENLIDFNEDTGPTGPSRRTQAHAFEEVRQYQPGIPKYQQQPREKQAENLNPSLELIHRRDSETEELDEFVDAAS